MVREREAPVVVKKKLLFIRLVLPAGEASPVPPLSAALGQVQISAADFCKQFNAHSLQSFESGTLLVVNLYRTYENTFFFRIKHVFIPFLFFQAQNEYGLIPVETLYDVFRIYFVGNFGSNSSSEILSVINTRNRYGDYIKLAKNGENDLFRLSKMLFGALRSADMRILVLLFTYEAFF